MFRSAPATAVRRALVPLLLCCALLAGATACGGDDGDPASPTGTSSAERQKFAKTRFVTNAGLAAGATYQWIVKPYRDGRFKAGADGRRFALVKAGIAGAFSYNRLRAALRNAQGDAALARAMAPLTAGIEALKDLPSKLRKGDSTEAVVGSFDDTINSVKEAGRAAGVEVTDQVPSAGQLTKG
ncbi:hypothetical protein C9F11_13020 [Streptomyces sp. YIM 121038]|uniref:hypothetical protein n=1 Tax=Streptomyces sp. YIM 121038 TaxID=2136401 RepID=UPI001110002E|nr:hypothetical protein [Streptomyces sp. YIM 121038]QCX76281.1 hypothetical protein C9F11_13020 [Streptomyces sp. YIM 121038]